jgi:phytoene dehydrogenase-like protein
MKETFDAIIIGGGHNGQILSAYLTKAGLETLVLERRMEPGGGLCTEEVTVPGFYHNVHTFFLRWVPDLPFYKDLELANFGVQMKMPEVQTVAPFNDGRCWSCTRTKKKPSGTSPISRKKTRPRTGIF